MNDLKKHAENMKKYRAGDRSPEAKAANSHYQREYYQKRKLKKQKQAEETAKKD